MLKLRVVSDLHLEFADLILPTLEGDKDTVLILGGDIGLVHKNRCLHEVYLPFLSRCSAQFRSVILIMGNHEHYLGSFVTTIPNMRGYIAEKNFGNVVLLEKETYVIDNVAFIGATLWTDCDNHSPSAAYLWNAMADARVIRTGPISWPYERKLLAEDTWEDHAKAKQYVFNAVDQQKALGNKTVVVVHHCVTQKSVAPQYVGNQLNMFFTSELTNDILDHSPDLIIHGHTHTACQYFVDASQQHCNTQVVCNPRGYVPYENETGFNPLLTITIS